MVALPFASEAISQPNRPVYNFAALGRRELVPAAAADRAGSPRPWVGARFPQRQPRAPGILILRTLAARSPDVCRLGRVGTLIGPASRWPAPQSPPRGPRSRSARPS